jgi:hypothetical protein
MVKGFAVEKISSAGFCFVTKEEVVGVRFLDLCLKGSTRQSATQCTQRGKVSILELDLMVEQGK